MESMFLCTYSVEAAHICGVYVILILGHDKSLNNGQQDLTKLNTKQAAYAKGLCPISMHMALVGIYHY
jgi:hypothetical protein